MRTLEKASLRLQYAWKEVSYRWNCLSLRPARESKGNVLFSYSIEDFIRLQKGESLKTFAHGHSATWESIQKVRTFLDLGYSVDIIDTNNKKFIPRKDYVFCLDVRANLERLAPLLNQDCIKLYYPLWAHWAFHNAAIYERLLGIQKRRGVSLPPRRLLEPHFSLECADYVIQMGDRFTAGTYSYAQKPMLNVLHSSSVLRPWPQGKDLSACRKRFLWLGGSGLAYKGLDLVLEAFAQMPNYQLTVLCFPEPEFAAVYHQELYEMPNISTLEPVNVDDPAFQDISDRCIGLVYPTAAELCCGSVLDCMHSGLIPIVSPASGVAVQDFGITLPTCTIDAIKSAVETVANLPVEQLEKMSYQAWEYANANHTREQFAQSFKAVISEIIAVEKIQ